MIAPGRALKKRVRRTTLEGGERGRELSVALEEGGEGREGEEESASDESGKDEVELEGHGGPVDARRSRA